MTKPDYLMIFAKQICHSYKNNDSVNDALWHHSDNGCSDIDCVLS